MVTLRLMSGVADHFLLRLPEWANTFVLLMFGETLLEPGNTFDRPGYAVLAHFASEDTWGSAFLVLGGVRLIALVADTVFPSFARWSVRLRALTATLCCVAWFCLSFGLYLANPQAIGWRTYAAHLIVDMILAVYLGRQADKNVRGAPAFRL